MLDSINFIINNVSELDTKRLVELGVNYYKLRYKKDNNGKDYVVYGDVKQAVDPGLISKGIGFTYENVYFMYLATFNCIVITANAHKVLNKRDILLSDRDTYINSLTYIVETALVNINYEDLELHRIDYCVDLELDNDIMYEYLHLLEKHKSTYQNIKRINDYESSIYLTSAYGQKRINIYDKYKCEKDKYIQAFEKAHKRNGIGYTEYEIQHPAEYEKYKNIFRIEVQNTKKLIKRETKNLQKEKTEDITPVIAHKISKSLYGYWNKESMQIYFLDFLKDYLYQGKYYKLNTAKKIINKYKNKDSEKPIITDRTKSELIEFITAVNRYGITSVTQSNNENEHPKWCGATVNKYYNDLESIGIPMFKIQFGINTDIKSEIDKINKSLYSPNWKSKLKLFLKSVNKYGLSKVTANDNSEITADSNYSKHKRWCVATVEKYIKILEQIGINPVTLNNNSKYNTLPSLYTLAKEKAERKYFDTDKLDIPVSAPIRKPRRKIKPLDTSAPVQKTSAIRRRNLDFEN